MEINLGRKMFQKIVGKVIPQELNFYLDEKDYVLGFGLRDEETKEKYRFTINERVLMSKFGRLYGFSMAKLKKDIKEEKSTIEDTEKYLKEIVVERDRNIVCLIDKDLKSIVSEKHKQVPLQDMYEQVKKIADSVGLKTINVEEREDTAVVEFEVGKNELASIRIRTYLGRNDALGRSSLRIDGSGNIFACSNAILPYVHKSIQFHSNMTIQPIRLFHTDKFTERAQERLVECFNKAKENAHNLNNKLLESRKIVMERDLQFHTINLLKERHNLGEKWTAKILKRLEDEDKTLFGLSQALTYVGTHQNEENSNIKDNLCRIGGQVVLLGEDLVKMLEKSLKLIEVKVNGN